MNQSPEASSRLFYGYIIAVAGFMIMVTMFSTRYSFGVFFKPVQTEFGWTRAMTSGAFSLSLLVEGLLGIVVGGLNDRVGPRAVLTFCGILLGIGCLLMSRMHDIWQLYLFFGVLMGIGMSGAWVPLTSTIVRWFIHRRTFMSGFVLSGTGLAAFIAPPIANTLISNYDWRNSFNILGVATIIIIVITAQSLKRDPSQVGQLPYGADMETEKETAPGGEGFSLKEAVSKMQFWLVISLLFCFGFCLFTIMLHIVPHVTDLKISSATAAKILAAIGGVAIIGRLVLGNLADRIGCRGVFILGFILISVTFFWLVPVRDAWTIYLFAVIFGFAQGGMGAAESPLVAEIFGLKAHGLIYGVASSSFMLGAAIGPWLAGYIHDVSNSYKTAFAVCAAMGIIGFISTTLLKQIRNEQTEASNT